MNDVVLSLVVSFFIILSLAFKGYLFKLYGIALLSS